MPDTCPRFGRNHLFGTTADTGAAADTFDLNNDGESTPLELANGQVPCETTRTKTPVVRDGGKVEFTYTRSNAALAEGFLDLVEWSADLKTDSWDDTGVSEQVLTDNGSVCRKNAAGPSLFANRMLNGPTPPSRKPTEPERLHAPADEA